MAPLRRTPDPGSDEEQLWHAIAGLVAEQRQARQLSQRELAELCGTTQSAIARIERGMRPPRLDTLRRIANTLDCELLVQLRPRTTTEEQGEDEDAH
jgi:transcriptional regulator with XRE-family HTH domain